MLDRRVGDCDRSLDRRAGDCDRDFDFARDFDLERDLLRKFFEGAGNTLYRFGDADRFRALSLPMAEIDLLRRFGEAERELFLASRRSFFSFLLSLLSAVFLDSNLPTLRPLCFAVFPLLLLLLPLCFVDILDLDRERDRERERRSLLFFLSTESFEWELRDMSVGCFFSNFWSWISGHNGTSVSFFSSEERLVTALCSSSPIE